MISGFYTAASGMVNQEIALNHMTDNIANAMVPGYKKQEVIFSSFDQDLAKEVAKMGANAKADVASGICISETATNFSQGSLRYSGQNTDVAIEGEGFFSVDTGNGVYYSRNGTFRLSNEGELVTPDGYKVLSADGQPITVDVSLPGVASSFGIDEDGTVYAMDNSKPASRITYGKIGISKFSNPENLERIGYGFWKNGKEEDAGMVVSDAKLRQGYVETSNVSPVESMVDMVYNQRLYDANAEMVKTLHQNIESFISAIGG